MFQFCDSKLQLRFILKEEVSISKKEIESLLDCLGEFLKAFDQANKVLQIPLPKPRFEVGFTKAKEELFSHCYKVIVEHLSRQNRLSFRFEKNNTCVFSIKKCEKTVINSFLQKLSTWVSVKSNFSTRINILLPTIVKFLRAITLKVPSRNKNNSPLITAFTRSKKTLKWIQIWIKRIRFLPVDDSSNIFIFQIILFNFNPLSTSQN